MLYSITVRDVENDETIYLNHCCLRTLSFGSHDMAWNTHHIKIAKIMLYRVKQKHADDGLTYEISDYS